MLADQVRLRGTAATRFASANGGFGFQTQQMKCYSV